MSRLDVVRSRIFVQLFRGHEGPVTPPHRSPQPLPRCYLGGAGPRVDQRPVWQEGCQAEGPFHQWSPVQGGLPQDTGLQCRGVEQDGEGAGLPA